MITLDLHGIRHDDANELIHRFINENWLIANELHIVTGHSQKMKNIVSTILKMYDVTSSTQSHNPGIIIVSI